LAYNTAVDKLQKYRLLPDEEEFHRLLFKYVMDGYVTKYPSEPDWDILFIEVPLAHRLSLCQKWHIGVADVVVRMHGGIWLVETKHSTMIPSDWEKKYELDNQTLGYCWHLRRAGIPVVGVMLNFIRYPDGRKTKYPEFLRSTYEVKDHLLLEWEEEQEVVMEEITGKWEQAVAAWPKNTKACFDWNRSCEYLQVCKGSISPAEVEKSFVHRSEEREVTILSEAITFNTQLHDHDLPKGISTGDGSSPTS
jgi:hypothetical protein